MTDKTIVLATSNRGKFLEMHNALHSLNISLLPLQDFPYVPEAPEEGNTFEEIALCKANFYYQQIHRPVLAEDSGLVIPALNGFPGIISARIAETDAERIRIILEKLKSHKDRSAFYHCSMVFLSSEGMIESQGRCDGTIVEAPRGNFGFGYDPVFELQETRKTFGEMNLEEKAHYSHRGRALLQMIPQLRNWIQNAR